MNTGNLSRLEEGMSSQGAGTISTYELPDMSTGNQTLALFNSSIRSSLPNHFSRLTLAVVKMCQLPWGLCALRAFFRASRLMEIAGGHYCSS